MMIVCMRNKLGVVVRSYQQSNPENDTSFYEDITDIFLPIRISSVHELLQSKSTHFIVQIQYNGSSVSK